MRLLLFGIATGLASLTISCNDKSGGVDSVTQKNLDAVHSINKAFETGDVSKLGDYITNDAVDHDPKGDRKGLDSAKAMIARTHTSGTDMKSVTVKELADHEYVFQLMHYTGTSANADMGMPAGTKYDMMSIEVTKHNSDGKVTEHWAYIDPKDMMKMMPPQPGMQMMDTSATH